MLKKPFPVHVLCIVQTGKLGHRIIKASYKKTQITRGGHRTRTHVCLTPNPVFFCYLLALPLRVCGHSQSLGRRGGRKAVHAGGRSQEQLKISWLESSETNTETSPGPEMQPRKKAGTEWACTSGRPNRWEPKPN